MAKTTQLYANNAKSLTTTGTINPGDTSMTITGGDGTLFPSPTGSTYFLITLESGSSREIVKVTAKSTDTFTIVRAQEGTSAGTWAVGTTVEMRVTRDTLTRLVRATDVMADTSTLDNLSDPLTSDANSYLTQSKDDGGTPMVAVKDTGNNQWRLITHPSKVIAAGVATGGSATTATTNTSLASLSYATGKYVIVLTSGTYAGYPRLITAISGAGPYTISWSGALPGAVVNTNTFDIYQSAFATLSGTYLPLAGGTLSGTLVLAADGVSGNQAVTYTQFVTYQGTVTSALAAKAALASPTFTGTPTLPTGTIAVTQAFNNSTSAVATTSMVQSAITNGNAAGATVWLGGGSGGTKTISGSSPSGGTDGDIWFQI